jgi:UDP:flavonoid glycosyltransferase YjiC (YdhE family)
VRVLFASTRGAGHFNPLVPFIEAGRRKRHDVLVRAAAERVLEDDANAAAAQRIADELRRLPPVDDALVA